MGSQIKTTIEASDVSREYFPKCLDQPLHLDESKTRMAEVLEDIKPVKIDIPLLNVTKQLPAYTTLLKKFCTQIEKSWTHILTFSITLLFRFKDHTRKLFNFLVQHRKAIHRGWVTCDCVWLKTLNLALLGGNPEMLFSIESLFFLFFSFLEFLFLFYGEMLLFILGGVPSSFYLLLPLNLYAYCRSYGTIHPLFCLFSTLA